MDTSVWCRRRLLACLAPIKAEYGDESSRDGAAGSVRLTPQSVSGEALLVGVGGRWDRAYDLSARFDFEARLGALRGKRSKRAVSDVARKEKDFGAPTSSSSASPAGTKKRKGVRDFTTVGDVSEPSGKNWGPETILYEGPPARGEIIANVAMSWTVVWIPLTIAASDAGCGARTRSRTSAWSSSPRPR